MSRVFTPANYPKWGLCVTASQRSMLVDGLERDRTFLSRQHGEGLHRPLWQCVGIDGLVGMIVMIMSIGSSDLIHKRIEPKKHHGDCLSSLSHTILLLLVFFCLSHFLLPWGFHLKACLTRLDAAFCIVSNPHWFPSTQLDFDVILIILLPDVFFSLIGFSASLKHRLTAVYCFWIFRHFLFPYTCSLLGSSIFLRLKSLFIICSSWL